MLIPNLISQTVNKMGFVSLAGKGKHAADSQWAERLFKQSSVAVNDCQAKAYFAERYQTRQSTFSAFFSGVGETIVDKAGNHADSLNYGEHLAEDAKQSLSPSLELHTSHPAALVTQFTVLNCYKETPDTKTFRLGRADGKLFNYLPGQYISLSVVIAGQEYRRSYSLASCPSRSGALEITVKRASKTAVVSNWLNDYLQVGDTLNLLGPYGRFTCGEKPPQKIFLLAAGSGIVPIMSMLRWLTDTEANVDIILLLSFRTTADIIYRDELQLLAARHHNIKLAITLSKAPAKDAAWFEFSGRVNETMLAELAPDLPERTVYLCGPEAFMIACKQHLQQLKLPNAQLFSENFTVSVPQDSSLGQVSAGKTGSYHIQFAKTCKTVATNGALTLLDLAENHGIRIRHDCRAGSCGECMVKCLKGRVEMSGQAEIAAIDKQNGWVFACCAYPTADAVLDV